MRFSEFFGIAQDQSNLDFLDIPLQTDIRLFLDPYSLAITPTDWAIQSHTLARNFFQHLLNLLVRGDHVTATMLIAQVHEDNRTRTGYSRNQPKGNAFGEIKAKPLVEALASSEAFKSGRIVDIEDTALFVEGIGIDLVSDIMINVLREHLADYTTDQCKLHGVPMESEDTFLAWRKGHGWVSVTRNLPTDGSRSILLLPRSVIRSEVSLKPEQFVTEVLNAADHGNRDALASLTAMLHRLPYKKNKSINRKDARRKLKEPGLKNSAVRLADKFPDALKAYKDRVRSKRHFVTAEDIARLQPIPITTNVRAVTLENRSSALNASNIQNAINWAAGSIVAAFHPLFQHPRMIDAPIAGLKGVRLADTTTEGPFWNARKSHSKPSELLLLATPNSISEKTFGLDWNALRTSLAVDSILVVGNELSREFRKARASSAKKGLFFASQAEIQTLADLDGGHEVILQAFENLMAQ